MPTITLGGKEYELFPPRRRIELVEVRKAVQEGADQRARQTCLGRAARALWLARAPASDEQPDRPLLHREPAYKGDPVAYGAEVFEALTAHYPEDEVENAAAIALVFWFAPEKLAAIPTEEAIQEEENFTVQAALSGKEKAAPSSD